MSLPNPEFGAAVRRVLEEHGLTFRGQRMRTGLNHVTVSNMAQGIVPRPETVAAFARGFGLDVNEWLTLAGYEPVETSPTGAQRFYAGLLEIQAEYPDRTIKMPRLTNGSRTLTVEDAEAYLADIRLFLQEEEQRAASEQPNQPK